MLAQLLQDLRGKIGIRKRINWLKSRFNYQKRVRIGNCSTVFPVLNGVSAEYSEPWMLGLLEQVLATKPGMFLDVGVNLGQTLVKVKSLMPERGYIGLEPNPVCVAYCQELIRCNNFENCKLLPAGVFTKDALLELNLFQDGGVDSAASIIDGFRDRATVVEKIYVPVFSYESLKEFLTAEKIGVLKIDVEGAEWEVLQGLSQMIENAKPWILMEILPAYSTDNQLRIERQDKIVSMMKLLDYALFRVLKGENQQFSGVEHIDDIEIHGDIERSDYLFVPAEEADRVPAL